MLIPKAEYLRIKVIPRSNKTEISEIMIDEEGMETIKIKVKAPPEKGKANLELLKFLGKELGINSAKLSIISGKSDTIKLIKIKWT